MSLDHSVPTSDRRAVLRAAAWAAPAIALAAAAPAYAASGMHTIGHDASGGAWEDPENSAPTAVFWWGLANASPDRTTPAQVQVVLPMGEALSVTLVPFDPGAWGEGWTLLSSQVSTTGEFTFAHPGISPGSAFTDQVTAHFVGDPRTYAGGSRLPYRASVTILPGSLTAGYTVTGSTTMEIDILDF